MPQVPWTFQYNYQHDPEWNRFTRIPYGNPVVNAVTTGQRRVEVSCPEYKDNIVFLSSDVPALDVALGITAEMMVNVSGPFADGNAGIEATFLPFAIAMQVRPNEVEFYSGGDGTNSVRIIVPTAPNNSDILWRITIDSNRIINIYRAGILVIGPVVIPSGGQPFPFQRFLWWVENGATATFKQMNYYQGGAVAP